MDKAVEFLTSLKDSAMGSFFSKKSKNRKSTSSTNPSGDHQLVTDTVQTAIPMVRAHQDAVSCLCNGSNMGEVYSGGKDGAFTKLDVISGQLLQKQSNAHEREITKIAFCNLTHTLITGSRDKKINIWKEMSLVGKIESHSLVVTGLDISNNGEQLCSGSRDNTVKIWDVSRLQCISESNIPRNLVSHMRWVPGSNLILQTGEDKEFRIWDSRNLKVSVSFPRQHYFQNYCDISSDLRTCVTSSNGFGGNGCHATLWDIRGGAALCELQGHQESVGSCTFLDNLVVTGCTDNLVRVWDPCSPSSPVSHVEIAGAGPMMGIVADSGAKRITVATFNLGIHVLQWTPSSRKLSSFTVI